MRTHEYLANLAQSEKRAALEEKLRSLPPEALLRYAHQHGVMLEKDAQMGTFLTDVVRTGSGLLRNLGVARTGLQAVNRFTGNRGIAYGLGTLIANPQASKALNRAISGGFGDWGRGTLSQAARAGRDAIAGKGSFTGLGQKFLQGTDELANSVNRFGREAFGTKAYQGHMLQRGFNVQQPLLQRFKQFMTKQRGPWASAA